MRNPALHATLAAFVTEAAHQLCQDVAEGAEIPFELIEQGRSAAPLYCYRPLSDRFIAERARALSQLPSYGAAVAGLAALPSLAGYLRIRRFQSDGRATGEAGVSVFLCAVWAEATEFTCDEARFTAAYMELEEAAYEGASVTLVITPVEGLVLESNRVELGGGLSLVRTSTHADVPADLRGDAYGTLAVAQSESPDHDAPSLEQAGLRLRRLQTALRLWDAAEPGVGPVAWARTDGGPWVLIALPGGVRRAVEDCLLPAEEEDPLRAFCALIARRCPRSGELAWALRRFELGCERGNPLEALTDWRLAVQALLGEPGSGSDELAGERLAAICATADERAAVGGRLHEVLALERRNVTGAVRCDPAVEGLIAELGNHLRAVLRDVLCGHLDPELRRVADALGMEPARS